MSLKLLELISSLKFIHNPFILNDIQLNHSQLVLQWFLITGAAIFCYTKRKLLHSHSPGLIRVIFISFPFI